MAAEAIAERYARDALHDPLTGLANRTQLLDELGLALSRAARLDTRVGVLFLDLDGFKSVNDRYGHGAGDLLLMEMADRLTSVVRSTDLVARQGGDEFVLLCKDVSDERSLTVLAEAVAEAASTPWVLDRRSASVTASIGIRLAHGHERPDVVLRDADTAMYEAKKLGGSRWVVSDTLTQTRSAQRTDLEADVRRGVEAGEFAAWYQPVFGMQTGAVTGAEALVRWRHPSRGLVMPDEFVPAAEETGSIRLIGQQVLMLACQQAAAWGFDQDGLVMHVNTSANELSAHGFPALVSATLESAGLAPGTICLEITERQLINDEPLVNSNLDELRRLGVGLAIDDFGTEYASLSYLRRLPVDVLKIDRSFVADIAERPRDAALIIGFVAMARALGLRTIAEGVETPEQARILCQAGVSEAQGYHYGRPCDAVEWTKRWRSPGPTGVSLGRRRA